jgi:hypothetical protein
MDDRATFETRAVLGAKRTRLARLALLVPAAVLVSIAWAGFSGPRSHQVTAESTAPTAPAVAVLATPRPQPPGQVLGLTVHPLDAIQPRALGRDEVIVVAGWYRTTAINDCPPLAAIYRDGELPYLRGDADTLAFCVRSGVLYGTQPGQNDTANAALPSVAVTLATGIVVPPDIEVIGGDSTEVIVLGRFVQSGDECQVPAGCRPRLVVDHVAWTANG